MKRSVSGAKSLSTCGVRSTALKMWSREEHYVCTRRFDDLQCDAFAERQDQVHNLGMLIADKGRANV